MHKHTQQQFGNMQKLFGNKISDLSNKKWSQNTHKTGDESIVAAQQTNKQKNEGKKNEYDENQLLSF